MASVLQLGEHAAEAIRELNHRTRARDAFADPVEFSWLLSDLTAMAGRLPQLLDQLDRWLRHEHDAGHLRADTDTDPGELVCLATTQLTRAGHCANDLADTLEIAHQQVTHLATA
jgi:hypothetical protein